MVAVIAALADGRPQTVSTRMRNLVFHLDKGVELRVAALSGAARQPEEIEAHSGGVDQRERSLRRIQRKAGTDPTGFLHVLPRRRAALYSKNTPEHGLKVYMPDLNDVESVRKAGGLTPR